MDLFSKCLYLIDSEGNDYCAIYEKMYWWWVEVGYFNHLFRDNFPKNKGS